MSDLQQRAVEAYQRELAIRKEFLATEEKEVEKDVLRQFDEWCGNMGCVDQPLPPNFSHKTIQKTDRGMALKTGIQFSVDGIDFEGLYDKPKLLIRVRGKDKEISSLADLGAVLVKGK